ncbi:MAG TPA: glycosyltransferase [Longimicrobium sp.]|nr:glycosyltransferase [Longimicrobium sp.]
MSAAALALGAIVLAAALAGYAYAGYPLLLLAGGAFRRRAVTEGGMAEWPRVSITVPAYNEAASIAATLDALLALDYPAERRQILVVSDASSDGTDDIVRGYAGRGVELLRLAERRGKTAAENRAAPLLSGDIIVNTDASVRLLPGSLKPLVAAFADPRVGLASGRDVSVARLGAGGVAGEGRYVGYEMEVRRLETRLGGIVGASGCFYAVRPAIHRTPLPEGLSRDFAAALLTRRAGYRAVSVDDAVCLVPRAASLHAEYRRKVRTITRGVQTLLYLRALLNPLRHGGFAWMLWSHKVCRWLVPWAGAAALLLSVAAAPFAPWARVAAAAGLAGAGLGVAAARGAAARLPRVLAVPAYVAMGQMAVLHACVRALRGRAAPTWEPTRRASPTPAEG